MTICLKSGILVLSVLFFHFSGCSPLQVVSVQQSPVPDSIASVLELTRGYWATDSPLAITVNERDPMQQMYGKSLISVQLENGSPVPVPTLVGETVSPYLYQFIDGALVQDGTVLFIRFAISINAQYDAQRCISDFYSLKKASKEWELGRDTVYHFPAIESLDTKYGGITKWLSDRFSKKFKIIAMRISLVDSSDSTDEYIFSLP